MSPGDPKKLDLWLGSVYLSYKPKYQPYFEMIMLLRRLILAIVLSMISSSSTLQTFLVWLVLMQSAITHLRLHPYEAHSTPTAEEQRKRNVLEGILTENVMDPAVLVVLSMSFMVLRFSVLDSSYAGFFVWVVVIVKTCALVVLVGAIFHRLICKVESRGNVSSGNGNNECSGASTIEDYNGDDEDERSHLLTANGQLRCMYVPIEDVA